MQRFLEAHPELVATYNLLQEIDQNKEHYEHLLDRDDLKLYKFIYKKKLYRDKEIQNYLSLYLQEIISQEKNSIENSCNQMEFMQDNHLEILRSKLYAAKEEKTVEDHLVENTEIKILRMFLGNLIFFSELQEKIFFLKNFKGLRKLFRSCGEKEFILQDLFFTMKSNRGELNRIEDNHSNIMGELNKAILEIKDDRVLVYFAFLSSYLTEYTKGIIFDRVSIPFKCLVVESLTDDQAYEKIAQVLLEESPKNKVLFLNTLEITDKPRVYLKIAERAMKKSLDHKKMFLETLDILKILPMDKKNSLLILISWAKTFIYHKNIEEGMKLYKQMMKVIGRDAMAEVMEEMVILSEFYSAVVEYKETGYLNFDKFIYAAQECGDENVFSPYKWKEISLMYQ